MEEPFDEKAKALKRVEEFATYVEDTLTYLRNDISQAVGRLQVLERGYENLRTEVFGRIETFERAAKADLTALRRENELLRGEMTTRTDAAERATRAELDSAKTIYEATRRADLAEIRAQISVAQSGLQGDVRRLDRAVERIEGLFDVVGLNEMKAEKVKLGLNLAEMRELKGEISETARNLAEGFERYVSTTTSAIEAMRREVAALRAEAR